MKPKALGPRTPVDTVALKKTIEKNDHDADNADHAMVAADRNGDKDVGNQHMYDFIYARTAGNRGRATLDSARAGKIPVKKGGR